MVRVVQISDTHIGRDRALFMRNWQPVLDWITLQNPSLVLHGGDITLDGADEESDFTYCTEILGTLPAPYLGVAGNHDVGTAPRDARQPVNADRLARWQRNFGADRWVHDIEDWRLIGFNTMIMGSGLPQEDEQFAWIEETMVAADGRRIAWLCHQPLFIHGYDDPDNGYWSVTPEPRKRMEALSRRFDIGLVGSGHLHISHDVLIDGTQFVWCPSTAFTVGHTQPVFPGEKLLGGVIYDFEGRSVRFERVHLPVLEHMWIEDVVQQVYPK